MNVKDMFPSRWLHADDLLGRDWTMSIRSVTLEEMEPLPHQGGRGGRQNGDDVIKPVIWFSGAKKGLIANKTNMMAIADLHGYETDNWIGKSISIYPTRISAFGKSWPVIRIRPDIPPAAENGHQPPPESAADSSDAAVPADAELEETDDIGF